MQRPSNNRFGLVWPAHHEDIANKALSDFVLVTNSMKMPSHSGILLDVKDIYGRTFFPTRARKSISTTNLFGHRGVLEAIHYAGLSNHELFLGVPILHDRMLAQTEMAMVNADGSVDGEFICPANPAVQARTVQLLADLAALAPAANLFLPFFRYPVRRRVIGTSDMHYSITRDQGRCFCNHCKRGFKNAFGYDLSWQKITSESGYFYDWLQWRCSTIEELAKLIARNIRSNKLVLEMDLCPKRFFLNGIFVDNGHDILALSDIFDHFLIHIFDRNPEFSSTGPTVDASNDVMYLNIERIKKRATVYLMMWNIRGEQDFQKCFDYANRLDVEIRFFMLYPNMMPWLLNRIQVPDNR
jgi:hypothetical protein